MVVVVVGVLAMALCLSVTARGLKPTHALPPAPAAAANAADSAAEGEDIELGAAEAEETEAEAGRSGGVEAEAALVVVGGATNAMGKGEVKGVESSTSVAVVGLRAGAAAADGRGRSGV